MKFGNTNMDAEIIRNARLITSLWLLAFALCAAVTIRFALNLEIERRECERTFDSLEQFSVLVDVCRDKTVRNALLDAEKKHDWRLFLDGIKAFSGGPD